MHLRLNRKVRDYQNTCCSLDDINKVSKYLVRGPCERRIFCISNWKPVGYLLIYCRGQGKYSYILLTTIVKH